MLSDRACSATRARSAGLRVLARLSCMLLTLKQLTEQPSSPLLMLPSPLASDLCRHAAAPCVRAVMGPCEMPDAAVGVPPELCPSPVCLLVGSVRAESPAGLRCSTLRLVLRKLGHAADADTPRVALCDSTLR